MPIWRASYSALATQGHGSHVLGQRRPLCPSQCFDISDPMVYHVSLRSHHPEEKKSRLTVGRIFPIHMMTPVWVFPAYPLLLSGPFAANLIASAVRSGRELTLNSTAVALCALATQGAGCLIAFMISSAFIYRLMTQKLPRDMQRPGVVGLTGSSNSGVHLLTHLT